MMSNKLPR